MTVQVTTTQAPKDSREKLLEQAMARHHDSGGALIEVLHVAQQLYGFLSPPLLKLVARKLKLPPSRVFGVATFYHLFRLAPAKIHSALVCAGTACYAAGSSKLTETLERRCDPNQWTLEAGHCIGSCGLAPVVICEGETLSRTTPAELLERVDTIEGGASRP